MTITELNRREERELIKKSTNAANEYIQTLFPNQHRLSDQINEILTNKNDPNNEIAICSIHARDEVIFNFINKMPFDNAAKKMIITLVNSLAINSIDELLKSEAFSNLFSKLEITEKERDLAVEQLSKITKKSRQEILKALTVNIDLNKYKKKKSNEELYTKIKNAYNNIW